MASYLALGKIIAYPYLYLAGTILSWNESQGTHADGDHLLDLRASLSTTASWLSVAAALWLLLALCFIARFEPPERQSFMETSGADVLLES